MSFSEPAGDAVVVWLVVAGVGVVVTALVVVVVVVEAVVFSTDPDINEK